MLFQLAILGLKFDELIFDKEQNVTKLGLLTSCNKVNYIISVRTTCFPMGQNKIHPRIFETIELGIGSTKFGINNYAGKDIHVPGQNW